MKRYKTGLACLLLALALLCTACGSRKKTEETDALASEALVTEDTGTLTYQNGTYTMRFARDEDGAWHWQDDLSFPVDEDRLRELLDEVSALSTLTPIQPDEDISVYDLESPDRSLSLSGNEGSLRLDIGTSNGAGGYYMCRDGDLSKIYVVPDTLVALMDRSIYELAQLPAVPAPTAEQLVSVAAVGRDGTTLNAARAEDGAWFSGGENVTEGMQAAEALLTGSLSFDRCVDYNPSSGALPICGLDTPAVTVTVTYETAKNTTESFTVKVGGNYDGGYFAMYNDVSAIWRLPAGSAETLLGLLSLAA